MQTKARTRLKNIDVCMCVRFKIYWRRCTLADRQPQRQSPVRLQNFIRDMNAAQPREKYTHTHTHTRNNAIADVLSSAASADERRRRRRRPVPQRNSVLPRHNKWLTLIVVTSCQSLANACATLKTSAVRSRDRPFNIPTGQEPRKEKPLPTQHRQTLPQLVFAAVCCVQLPVRMVYV